MRHRLAVLSLLVLPGCEELDVSSEPTGIVSDLDDFTGYAHPCVAYHTQAMWVDSRDQAFVGCGTGASGEGLYHTTDGGRTWSIPASPGGVLETMRVVDLWRSPQGTLYISGTGSGGARVLTLVDGEVGSFYLVPESRPAYWQTFLVGAFRVDGQGRALASSWTGDDVLYWPDVNEPPINGAGWWEGAVSHGKFLSAETYDGRFYATGSTLSDPPYFYYDEVDSAGETLRMGAIRLSPEGAGSFYGEAWDLAIDAQGDMLIAGVNQATNSAVAWYSVGDPTEPSSWILNDLAPLASGGSTTRLYGACRDGELLVVVGDYSQRGRALLFLSTDGGQTWEERSPTRGGQAVATLHRCQIVDEHLFVAGGEGYFGSLPLSAL
ncbi:MAG: hypothetical protein EA397_14540 [Deltaproteobacteria bacterium]|nr:MAG: hypothetical protein EA397_14540 [Deltaproteobacteria bacterium]